MIDIHCHILPGVDDGAATLAEALAMARLAVDSGVSALVATPHFPGEARSLRTIPRIVSRYRKLNEAIQRERIPLTLYPGAEILCTPDTPALAREGKLPTLGRSHYLLTEFYFDESFDFMEDILDRLLANGYCPVVAHPERYLAVQRRPQELERWFAKGYIMQVNKGSIMGAFGSKGQAAAMNLLRRGLVHVIASDAHHATQRTPKMTDAAAWVRGNLGLEYARILMSENPARILKGMPIAPTE